MGSQVLQVVSHGPDSVTESETELHHVLRPGDCCPVCYLCVAMVPRLADKLSLCAAHNHSYWLWHNLNMEDADTDDSASHLNLPEDISNNAADADHGIDEEP